MADKKKKKINFWEDPVFQNFFNPMMEQGLASRAAEQNRLNTLRTKVYGAGGALAQNELEASNAQNRLAEEMAYRGMLSSGAYAGPEKGTGRMLQGEYAAQKRGIEQGYAGQVSPQNLLEQGLKMNPDGSISPLVEGEEVTNPQTGVKRKYSWATDTSAGRQAKMAALAQYAMANIKTGI